MLHRQHHQQYRRVRRLLAGLRASLGLGISKIVIKGDSQLVIKQINEEYACPRMAPFVQEVWKLRKRFQTFKADYVPREDNTEADELSRIASQWALVPPGVFIEELRQPSAQLAKAELGAAPGPGAAASTPTPAEPSTPAILALPLEASVVPGKRTPPPWATDIVKHMRDHILPEDLHEAEKVARQARMYAMIDDELYPRCHNGVMLLCIPQEEGQQLLEEIHRGTCSSHVASRALVGKAFRQGFYWPSAVSDAEQLVRTCDACQFHAKNVNQPAQALQTIPVS